MAVNEYEQKSKSKIHTRPILSLLIGLTFFTAILVFALFEAGKNVRTSSKKVSGNQTKQGKDNSLAGVNKADISTLGIVLGIDKTAGVIDLFDINENKDIRLNFTGGTSFLDKYDQFISVDRVDRGLIVDISYQSEGNKLDSLKFSNKAWEYIGVNNMMVYPEDNTIKIAKSNYTYNNLFVLDGDSFISLEDLAPQDELTVRGIDETIWSITVAKGHGTVRIKDQEAFLGGSITVGYEAVAQVTENMVITVREGNYNLTIENGKYSGTKNVTVNRNEETVVSVGDLGPEPTKYGKITFEITPLGADLFIDKELTTYASPVELEYGEHSIEVSLGGYATYRGTLVVDYAARKIGIVLPELQSRDEVSITEVDYPTGTAGDDDGYIVYNDWDSEQNDTEDDPDYIDSLVDDEDLDEDPIVDEDSLIYIQNPAGASVYLNGEYKGVSPGSFKKVIGSHVLTFIKKGYKTKSYTIDIADDGLDTYISLPELEPER
jgi:hypothetical protein